MNADGSGIKAPKKIDHYLTCDIEAIRQGLKL